jgi:hypothetical protein
VNPIRALSLGDSVGILSDIDILISGSHDEWEFQRMYCGGCSDSDVAVNNKRGIIIVFGWFFASIREPMRMRLPLLVSLRVCRSLRRLRKEKLLDTFLGSIDSENVL